MAELGEAGRPSVEIRKYANRRLYDTDRSRYVTLADVARMVGDGARVRIVTADKGADITRQVLAQIVFEGETADGLLDEGLLRRLIELRRHPERGVLSRHLTGALDSFPDTPRRAAPPDDSRHRNDTRARIDALQTRVERLISDVNRNRR
jgi:polyhydroxyalkanoate synthesis repressor PhaR